MSRRSYTKFNYFDWQQASSFIVTLYDTMERAIAPTLTHEEMLSLIAQTEEHAPVGWRSTFDIEWAWGITVRFSLSSNAHVNAEYKLQEDAHGEIVDRLNEWIAHRVEMDIDFGRMQALAKEFLYRDIYTKKEARYHFPGILSLVKSSGLEEISVPRKNSVVGYPMRRAIEKVSLTLASALMLKDLRFDTPARVKLILHKKEYDEDGFKFKSYYNHYY